MPTTLPFLVRIPAYVRIPCKDTKLRPPMFCAPYLSRSDGWIPSPDRTYIRKHVAVLFFLFFFSRAFLTARRSKGTGLFYWAASRHRLFVYWPVSRCACGREGISPDLPLPGWEATARHSWAGEGEEVAEGWKVSVEIVVRGEILKQQAGSEGGDCCMGNEG